MAATELEFQSEVRASREEVWAAITSVAGIAAELSPLLRMTAPGGIANLSDVELVPGKPLGRSDLYLFMVIPIGHTDLTLLGLEEGRGFVEQSPMSLMRLWRHERFITSTSAGTVLTDRLRFEAVVATPVVAWFVRLLFNHRHAVLRRRLGEVRRP